MGIRHFDVPIRNKHVIIKKGKQFCKTFRDYRENLNNPLNRPLHMAESGPN